MGLSSGRREQLASLAGGQGGGERHCTNAAHEHGGRQHVLAPESGSSVGEPGRRGPRSRTREITSNSTWSSGCLRDLQDDDARDGDDRRAPEHDADREAQHVAAGCGGRTPPSTSLPRASAKAARNSTARVVTLMPPAVEAEPPPMNMSMSVTSRLEPLRSEMSIVEKPPDLVIMLTGTATGRPCRPGVDVAEGLRVVELEHDVERPCRRRCRISVVSSVSLTCSDQRRGLPRVARRARRSPGSRCCRGTRRS